MFPTLYWRRSLRKRYLQIHNRWVQLGIRSSSVEETGIGASWSKGVPEICVTHTIRCQGPDRLPPHEPVHEWWLLWTSKRSMSTQHGGQVFRRHIRGCMDMPRHWEMPGRTMWPFLRLHFQNDKDVSRDISHLPFTVICRLANTVSTKTASLEPLSKPLVTICCVLLLFWRLYLA